MTVEPPSPAPPEAPASWAAVIVNWNGAADLPACLAAVAAQGWPPAEIVIVDNASSDGSLAVLAQWSGPAVRTIASNVNLGFAGGANAGLRATSTPLVAILNPDVTLYPTWASALRTAFRDPHLGAAGGKLLYADSRLVQHVGGAIDPISLVAINIGRGDVDVGQHEAPAEVDFLTGAALMLRRAAVDSIGLFDEAFYPAYYEDVDLCVRLRAAGWGVRYVPSAVGLHRESASVDGSSTAYFRMIHAGRLRYAVKHLPLATLVDTFLPAEARRLSEASQHATGAPAADQTGRSVFPTALVRRPNTGQATASDLPERVAEVGQRWLVEERPFRSSVPVIGPVVAWLRSRLNDAGPRWHVRAILAQQIEFNAAVYRAVRAIATEADAGQLQTQATAAVLTERLEALATEQQRLLDRLQSLEQRLTALAPGDNAS